MDEKDNKFFSEQLFWLIRLRWVAVASIAAVAFTATYFFPVLTNAVPIYVCAGILFLLNIFYFGATKKNNGDNRKNIIIGMFQAEADLVILTVILHFSGGIINPFIFFYIFHVIIATIILPRNFSFSVALTAIVSFGLLAVNELNGGGVFGYYPLRLSVAGGIWRNPVYVLGAFVAFVCTIILSQYLTRIIIARISAKEKEAIRNFDVLQAIINAMSEGLIFLNCDEKIIICNPAAKLWKTKNSDSDLVHDFPEALTEYIKKLFDNKLTPGHIGINFETCGTHKRYIQATSCPVTGTDGEKLGFVIVGQDLTGHKKLEKDLLERTEDLTAINEMLKMSRIKMAQREKMVAVGQMAAGIAHEIGNPLASLSSVAQYLGRKVTSHEEKENLLIMGYHIDRISKILRRMLSLSQPATAEYKWVDINEIIDNTLSLLKFDKRMQNIEVENVPSLNMPLIWIAPQSFEQVLINIFINAMDAINAVKEERKNALKIIKEIHNEMIEIRISDTGIGMSPAVCKRAFESFFTTKEIGKGTGLGLFISYNLISELDGSIRLESEINQGTTVIIQIPVRPKNSLIDGTQDNSISMSNITKECKN